MDFKGLLNVVIVKFIVSYVPIEIIFFIGLKVFHLSDKQYLYLEKLLSNLHEVTDAYIKCDTSVCFGMILSHQNIRDDTNSRIWIFLVANHIVEFLDIDHIWFVVSPKNPLKKKRIF